MDPLVYKHLYVLFCFLRLFLRFLLPFPILNLASSSMRLCLLTTRPRDVKLVTSSMFLSYSCEACIASMSFGKLLWDVIFCVALYVLGLLDVNFFPCSF